MISFEPVRNKDMLHMSKDQAHAHLEMNPKPVQIAWDISRWQRKRLANVLNVSTEETYRHRRKVIRFAQMIQDISLAERELENRRA